MKKLLFLIITIFISFSGYSQLSLEGFESTTGPIQPTPTIPSAWTLGAGDWSVFDSGLGNRNVRWDVASNNPTYPAHTGTNVAFVDREYIGQGVTSEDYLATPLVNIPTNGQLRFLDKNHYYWRSINAISDKSKVSI
jgi:hypothetical protein